MKVAIIKKNPRVKHHLKISPIHMKTTNHKNNRGVSSSFRRQMTLNSQIISNSHKNYPREDYRKQLQHKKNSTYLYKRNWNTQVKTKIESKSQRSD
jgi:hypothetical protein